ncbi:hypothetical protein ACN9MF_20225 [Methylobacterium fujisawaense]|uniref:hypothetical protein n=1 Tax=Methylobacterium fujisawaense TaxID=107400 RepID=UPI003CFA3EF7
MRTLLAALALVVAAGSAMAAELPTKSCSAAFIKHWRADKEAAMENMPSRPCLMRAKTGTYVCYKDGCVREQAYLDDN